ncbi:hypothetical protein AAE478_000753 [Parahypoxylon ruwenzoriense]
MIALRWALGAIVAATTVSASADELQLFARLLKRQEPGTPAYNCHDNCGQAIIQARNAADVCNDDTFLTDYKACLQCAGPDNEDIWRYYGGTLTSAAASCGLSTTPLTGDQPDVGPAIPAGSAATTSSEATPSDATSTPETSPTEAPTTTPQGPTTTEDSTEGPGSAATTSTGEGTPSATGVTSTPDATETASGYPTASATVTSASSAGSSATNVPTSTGSDGSGNGTATTSSGFVVVTNGANPVYGSAVGFYGALALGALYAAA